MNPNLSKFQTNKKNRKFRVRIYLILSGLFLFSLGIFYAIRISPIFQIRNFNISGKEHLTNDKILDILKPLVITTRIKTFLGAENILSWNVGSPDTSKTGLVEALIGRDWIKQSVDISIKERERLAIWCDSKGNCGWIDNEGMIFEKAPQVEGSLIMTVFDIHSEYLSQGARISENRFIGNIIKIISGLKDLHFAIKKINFDSKLQEIGVETYSGPDLMFSIRFDPTMNLDSLKSLAEKSEFKRYKYVDLRVENRIYYKTL